MLLLLPRELSCKAAAAAAAAAACFFRLALTVGALGAVAGSALSSIAGSTSTMSTTSSEKAPYLQQQHTFSVKYSRVALHLQAERTVL